MTLSHRSASSRAEDAAKAHRAQVERHLTKVGPTGKLIGEPTPERVIRAKEAGDKAKVTVIVTEAGHDSGHSQWRIVPALDNLKNRGTITNEEYDAALRYCRYFHFAAFKGPATVRYAPRYDNDMAQMTPTERMIHCRQKLVAVTKQVDTLFHPALAWLIKAMEDADPLHKLGSYYAPHLGEVSRSQRGAQALSFALASLCRIWGMNHRLVDRQISDLAKILLQKF